MIREIRNNCSSYNISIIAYCIQNITNRICRIGKKGGLGYTAIIIIYFAQRSHHFERYLQRIRDIYWARSL